MSLIAEKAKVGRSRLSTIVNNVDHYYMEEGPSSVLTKVRRAFGEYFPPKQDKQDVMPNAINDSGSTYNKTAQSNDDYAARTEELINTLKEHNKILKDVIEKNLDSLQTNLRTSQLLLRSLQTSQSAQHDVMMGSLERIEKRKKGSLAADADKLEFELNLQLQGADKRGDGGKLSNRES